MEAEKETPPGGGGAAEKRSRKREMIVNEIISSEAVYLSRLLTLRDVYLIPIREGHVLTNAEYTGQFWQLEAICDLHVRLNQELSCDIQSGDLQVGKIFTEFSHFLKMYKQFLSCFAGGGLIKRAKLLTSNKKFSDFVYAAQKDPRCQGMSLDSYLIEPVQRIPRYCMLLDELLKCTDESHPDYNNLHTAVMNVRKVAVENNEAIRQQEEAYKIYQVMLQIASVATDISSSSSSFNLLDDPKRRFLLQGDLVRQCRNFRKTFRFWLFSDKLLYGEEEFAAIREGMYRVNRELLLSRCNITSRDDMVNNEYTMRVQSPAKSFYVYFKGKEERDEWVNAVTSAIQLSQPSVDNHRLAPVWKVDSNIPDCELCFVKFSFFNRRHHCRKCGSIVCQKCSSNRALLKHVDAANEVRICDNCFIYKIGTLNVGIGSGDSDSNDYTVDLNRFIERSKDNEADVFSDSTSFSGGSEANKQRSVSPLCNRTSTSSRYRDSLNTAEVKNIQAATMNKNNRKNNNDTQSSESWFCCCFPCFCGPRGDNKGMDSTERSEGNNNRFTDPLLTTNDGLSSQ